MRARLREVVLVVVVATATLQASPTADTVATQIRHDAETEFFPILSYDTDAGFGYGGKLFTVSSLGMNESFDLTIFNSSKGERWYRLVFSLPDLERRQGTVYPLAIDVAIDYDKWIAANFFGMGGGTRFGDREAYTKEPLDVSITFSRGFTRQLVGRLGSDSGPCEISDSKQGADCRRSRRH